MKLYTPLKEQHPSQPCLGCSSETTTGLVANAIIITTVTQIDSNLRVSPQTVLIERADEHLWFPEQ